MKTALIAIGGNSLIRAGEKGTVVEQLANAQRTAAAILGLIRDGYHLVLTHGNGPQVGAALLRSERASDQVPGHSLDVCDACTQGEIGYLLQQALHNELSRAGLAVPVVTVLTQVVVSPDDPAMQHPTKPIGPFYSRADAEQRRRAFGWQIVEDAARGYRRVVPSPEPVDIVELEIIRDLVARGVLVIAAGGGGIPVVRSAERNGYPTLVAPEQKSNGWPTLVAPGVGATGWEKATGWATLSGIDAVIDKDRASALLASRLGVDLFAISTDTDFVYLDYKKPAQRPITCATAPQMQEYSRAGHFPPGNMGPKVESALRFLADGGREVVITSYEHLYAAIAGRARGPQRACCWRDGVVVGTHIVPATAGLQRPRTELESLVSR